MSGTDQNKRKVQIDDKWAIFAVDPFNGKKEGYAAPHIERYGEVSDRMPNNFEIAAAQRIMQLEDLLQKPPEMQSLKPEEFKSLYQQKHTPAKPAVIHVRNSYEARRWAQENGHNKCDIYFVHHADMLHGLDKNWPRTTRYTVLALKDNDIRIKEMAKIRGIYLEDGGSGDHDQ
jgi:hypothetical protein